MSSKLKRKTTPTVLFNLSGIYSQEAAGDEPGVSSLSSPTPEVGHPNDSSKSQQSSDHVEERGALVPPYPDKKRKLAAVESDEEMTEGTSANGTIRPIAEGSSQPVNVNLTENGSNIAGRPVKAAVKKPLSDRSLTVTPPITLPFQTDEESDPESPPFMSSDWKRKKKDSRESWKSSEAEAESDFRGVKIHQRQDYPPSRSPPPSDTAPSGYEEGRLVVDQIGPWTHTRKRLRSEERDQQLPAGGARHQLPFADEEADDTRPLHRVVVSSQGGAERIPVVSSVVVVGEHEGEERNRDAGTEGRGGEQSGAEDDELVIDLTATEALGKRKTLGINRRVSNWFNPQSPVVPQAENQLRSPPSSEKKRMQISLDEEFAKSLAAEDEGRSGAQRTPRGSHSRRGAQRARGPQDDDDAAFAERLYEEQLRTEFSEQNSPQQPPTRVFHQQPHTHVGRHQAVRGRPLQRNHQVPYHPHQLHHHVHHPLHYLGPHGGVGGLQGGVPFDIDNLPYEDLLRLSDAIGDAKGKGASKAVLKTLPVVIYKQGEGDQPTCPICLSDFVEGEKLNLVPCSHRFHDVCIQTWLKANGICPICRVKV